MGWFITVGRLVIAQTTPQCVALDSSTPCGLDYTGYPVLQSQFASVAAFTAAVQSNIADLNQVADSFVNNYGCTTGPIRPALEVMRYQVSIQCSMAINDAIVAGCSVSSNRPPKGPLLCTQFCSMAGTTVQQVFQNTTACSAPGSNAIAQARTNLLTQYSNYCTFSSNAIAAGAPCTGGAQAERDLCGWRNNSTAIAQCTTNFKDTCCTNLTKLSTVSAGVSSKSNLALYIGLGIGGVVLLVVGAILAVYLYRRRSQSYVDHEDKAAYQANQYRGSHKLEEIEANSTPKGPITALYSPPSLAKSATSNHNSIVASNLSAAPAAPPSSANSSPPITMNNLPPTARKTRVLHPYEPTLPDELRLEVGLEIIMVRAFDDGWALGFDPNTSKQGAFPLVCVAETDDQSTIITTAPNTVIAAPNDSASTSILQRSSNTNSSHRTSSQMISSSDRLAVSSLVATTLREKQQRDQRIRDDIAGPFVRTDLSAIERRQREREEETERVRLEELDYQRRREERERERLQREQERLRLEQERIDRERNRVQRELFERERTERELRDMQANTASPQFTAESPTGSKKTKRSQQPISKFLTDLDEMGKPHSSDSR
ncbi:hypothetical protein BDEG_21672 [Batrachochytrium dendrobatidis JEL423]|nr:hypothetical protein BDEG_21672 [Batrachochytrium dendrobatidis JEL423]